MLYRSVYLYFQSHVIFLSNIENSYKMELPFSTHPFSYPSSISNLTKRSHTHTHTLFPLIMNVTKTTESWNHRIYHTFLFPSHAAHIHPIESPPPIIREYLSRDSANLHWPKMFFLLFFSLLSFFPSLSPPVVRLLQLIQPGSLKSN